MKLFNILNSAPKEPSRNVVGFPPSGPDYIDVRLPLPDAMFLILKTANLGGSCTLDRYSIKGKVAGDTWHQSVEDAKLQAHREFGGALGEWHTMPAETEKEIDYVLRLIEAR
jgi:hypothetical protein